MRKYIIVMVIIAGLMFAENLLVNGDFEAPITTGWQSAQSGSNVTIDRATTYDPDPDYEAQSKKGYGSGYAKLYQVVDVATTDLLFTIDALLYAYDNNADTSCWAAAAVIISYKNSVNTVLGETRICSYTTPCSWQSTSTCHLIHAPNNVWQNHSFNIDDELTNLPGVNPAQISKIEVSLYGNTLHTC